MNSTEIVEAVERVKRARDELGIPVLMVKHVMKAVMGVSNRIIVLHHGEKITEGTHQEIAKDERIIEAYLGEKHRI